MKLIAFSGKKQSGKNSAANFVVGQVLLSKGIIEQFMIDKETGGLVLEVNEKDNFCEVDLLTRDTDQKTQLEQQIFPYVKLYSFADPLKEFCVNVLGIEEHKIFGTNNQKDELTHIYWETVPKPDKLAVLKNDKVNFVECDEKYIEKTGLMTGREVLQYFGTDVCRAMYHDCWVAATLNKIKKENPEVAIIVDCRFKNEFYGIKKEKGRVVRLGRNMFPSEHRSETDMDDISEFDYDWFIQNQDMTLEECHNALYPHIKKWRICK